MLVGFLVVRGRRAEGRGFDDFLAEHHVHQLEAPADDAGAAKQRPDLLGRGIGGHVEILGLQAHDQVAHRAADDIGFVAMLAQDVADFDGVARDIAAIDAMAFRADALWAAQGRREQPADKFSYGFGNHLGLRIFEVVEQVDHLPSARLGDFAQARLGLAAIGRVTASSKGTSLTESL